MCFEVVGEGDAAQKYGLWKVPYYADTGDDKIIFNDGPHAPDFTPDEGVVYQTKDLNLVEDGYYGKHYESEAGGLGEGPAAKLVYDISVARATYEGLENSVCGISSETAKSLVERYDALSDDSRKKANGATFYTYQDKSNPEEKADVLLEAIIATLRTLIHDGAGASAVMGDFATSPLMIVFACLATLGLGILGFYLAKKKKEE